MAIKLKFNKTEKDLTGRSKMWGCPDFPDSLDYPEVTVNDDLHTHRIIFDDGSEYGLEAEEISFENCQDKEDGFKLLGRPYLDEIEEFYPGWTSLLQLDCHDGWNLQFFDCGMLCFLTNGKEVKCYLHSF